MTPPPNDDPLPNDERRPDDGPLAADAPVTDDDERQEETPGDTTSKDGGNRGLRIGAVVLALLLVAGIVVAIVKQTGGSGDDSAPQASASTIAPPASDATTQPSGNSTVTSVPGCMPATTTPITPTRMKIDGMPGEESKVLSLGLDESGAAAAPPKDEPRTVAWYKLGPKPGSAKGNVSLSIHTYHQGGALGNQMYTGDHKLTKGDVIRLSDASGRTVCYRYDHLAKIKVADYDPQSKIFYDSAGTPKAVICICWDYDKASKDWKSRVFFYATPITA